MWRSCFVKFCSGTLSLESRDIRAANLFCVQSGFLLSKDACFLARANGVLILRFTEDFPTVRPTPDSRLVFSLNPETVELPSVGPIAASKRY